jgi:hypothetical protein
MPKRTRPLEGGSSELPSSSWVIPAMTGFLLLLLIATTLA